MVTTTVEMDEKGRIVIPQAVRKSLGVDGENAILELEVSVVEQPDE
ncbi:hypothetical protein EGH25_09415 [Haladaptatus sp. F3-133]|jgi:bifunctional DNA-binding transcriptional regulator/antitoxin component of YhaV-PrlF toxin-antitoxin module|uniref:SpoVT-AbrB domain-containing protein n=1 Tax=Halorutilus salinus TaxID=2487751 RepID=A0A9Q4C5M6_9EURY|nr:hypothetical protein [Halorutilus salinus]MCX2819565.1 hypothetical protein [Halorutilus salinus]